MPGEDIAPAIPGFEHIRRYRATGGETTARIMPGEYYVTRDDEEILTVLGSCISACIWDPVSRVGGMNHFMLPETGRTEFDGADAAARYGSYAMEHLINDVLKAGGRRERLKVKLVGGGRVLAAGTDIGAKNIAFAQRFVEVEGLELVSSDVGGDSPRKVKFHPLTGRAKVARMPSIQSRTVIAEEIRYRETVEAAPVAGDVELF